MNVLCRLFSVLVVVVLSVMARRGLKTMRCYVLRYSRTPVALRTSGYSIDRWSLTIDVAGVAVSLAKP